MPSRRAVLKRLVGSVGMGMMSSFWANDLCANAFAQTASGSDYKALVVVTKQGGNDANNMLIPMDSAAYAEYALMRTLLAIPKGECNPLAGTKGGIAYGLHPALKNVARMYNAGRALVVANIGPIRGLYTKNQLLQQLSLLPDSVGSHPGGVAEWESASTQDHPSTGWGGRIADLVAVPGAPVSPMFVVSSPESIFTVGRSVQGVALQSTQGLYTPLPAGISAAVLSIAQNDALSHNLIVAQAAQLRTAAMNQQALLKQAQSAGSQIKTAFPADSLGQQLATIAQTINGRSLLGATRQIFYCQQGGYDSHSRQLAAHSENLSSFDAATGAFFSALQELGLADQVILCTHSDFNRTMTANVEAGSDHAWGTHQLVIGGGITGGRIIGDLPDPELGGSADLTNGYGCWIPSLAPSQMCAAIGKWMGLTSAQLLSVFPDLGNFHSGAVSLS